MGGTGTVGGRDKGLAKVGCKDADTLLGLLGLCQKDLYQKRALKGIITMFSEVDCMDLLQTDLSSVHPPLFSQLQLPVFLAVL